LTLVEHEAERPDEGEVVGGEGVERGDVAGDLGACQRAVEVGELFDGAGHVCLLGWIAGCGEPCRVSEYRSIDIKSLDVKDFDI
jgi:hypothetical protein